MFIFSLSHPNSNRWYKNKNIKLSWPRILGDTYYYSLSKNYNLEAGDKVLSTKDNQLDTSVDEDGIYYFHLQIKDAMDKIVVTSVFKIMVDSTSSLAPNILVSSKVIKKGYILRLDFNSEDVSSGLQSGFYININNSIFLPVKPPFFLTSLNFR